ncbi:hypothetical protein, partial [Fictibacillus barbaricus]|uniref:hypothetical protein n=1 Tax=Fictibacillus barbaricus TaxID=182136 RepID=UPI00286B81F5
DKQKGNGLRRRFLPSDHLTFDLEGLTVVARQSEKQKRFVQPRQAKGKWVKKALFAFRPFNF